MKYLIIACITIGISACSYKTSIEEVSQYQNQFVQDPFTLSGDYHWNFQLMGTTQQSIHSMYADSIQYVMEGKVYSTDYTMEKLSYNKTNGKWIGRDNEGIVYVLFFKDHLDSTLTIYKHKCKDDGIQEALSFELPAPDATADHGWNIYSLGNADPIDTLEVNGRYALDGRPIYISDSSITYEGREYRKLSYHQGERRWMGEDEDGNQYLQVFFQNLENTDILHATLTLHQDLEAAYKIKYEGVSFKKYERQ